MQQKMGADGIRRNENSKFGLSGKLKGHGGLLEFALEHKRLTEILVAEWPAPKLLIDNTRHDYEEDQNRVLSFVRESATGLNMPG